jgi:hypothetical protein
MFEKLPTATMNNSERFAIERLIAGAHEPRDKDRLREALRHFPSYLRLFDNFRGLLISETHWVAARLLAGCCGRFPTAHAHVAFL